MADLKLRREHQLGRARARKVALKWGEHVEKKFEMECMLRDGETHDVLEFRRQGVEGRMIVAADYFDIDARLGAMFRPFIGMIEAETRKQLDAALAKEMLKLPK